MTYDDLITGDKFKDAFPSTYSKIDEVDTKPRGACILTHNGDRPVDGDLVAKFPHAKVWAGQNIECEASWVFPLAIGLENDYNSGAENRKRHLFRMRDMSGMSPTGLCYYNCRETHEERRAAQARFAFERWCTKSTAVAHVEWCSHVLHHQFIICPRGNGLDCHRNWETLYLGRYPVMRRLHSLERLYKGLPVLFVDEWQDVTHTLLADKADEFRSLPWNWDKLKFSYWRGYVEGLFS